MRFSSRFCKVLYQDPGFIEAIKRLSALVLIWIMPFELYNVFFITPYHVPSWRLGTQLVGFPEPPVWISVGVWSAYFLACLAVLAGVRKRILPWFIFFVWVYYQSVEASIFYSGYVILLACYFAAFAIDRRPYTLSRRVIQVAISTCYVYSALQKLHPEFIGGHTMHDYFGVGTILRPEFQPLFKALALPFWLTQASSVLVVLLEAFIGVALWFRATRKWAIAIGLALHLSFSILIPGIEPFAIVVWLGYLAFCELPHRPKSLRKSLQSKSDLAIAAVISLVCILVPARFYFLDRTVYLHLMPSDIHPWGFSMYLCNEAVRSKKLSYQTAYNSWHTVPKIGRMTYGHCSFNEMLAMAHYVERIHPEATLILVEAVIEVNSHIQTLKTCEYIPKQHKIKLNQYELRRKTPNHA